MRGWIMAASWYRRLQLPVDDLEELVSGPLGVVVHDHVVELVLLLELALRALEPLLDLAAALGRARTQATLELGERRRRTKIVTLSSISRWTASAPSVSRSSNGAFPPPGCGRSPTRASRPAGPTRSRRAPGSRRRRAPLELRVADEVVLGARAPRHAGLRARRRRDRKLELGTRHHGFLEGSLSRTRRSRSRRRPGDALC